MGVDFEENNYHYENIFKDFEKYVEKINNNINFFGNINIYTGYLVDNNGFEEMKNELKRIYIMRKINEQNSNHNE